MSIFNHLNSGVCYIFFSETRKFINPPSFFLKQQLEVEVAKLDPKLQGKTEKLSELLELEKFSEELGSVTMLKSVQMNMELQDRENQ